MPNKKAKDRKRNKRLKREAIKKFKRDQKAIKRAYKDKKKAL